MASVEEIKEKYACDSKGNYGNISDPHVKRSYRKFDKNESSEKSLKSGDNGDEKVTAQYHEGIRSAINLNRLVKNDSGLSQASMNIIKAYQTFIRLLAQKRKGSIGGL